MKKAKAEIVFQVGFVVNSVDDVIRNLKTYFEIEEDSIDIKSTKEMAEQGVSVHNEYNGVPTEFYIKRARLNFGGIDFEYIEPLDQNGGDPYSDWLKIHGQGMHHMNMKLKDRTVMDEIMKKEGRPQHILTEIGGMSLETYDLRDLFGFICEFGDRVVGPMAKIYYEKNDNN